ncbi:hypothetical protein RRG08_006408 [Elysia crispata]|uniref:Uncharacterized protein n=1 Tax=Elysia crispata TaxID=231223 RepID=A0AAE1CRI8_9GAST|nr:hypothetical protein RRG08_006408 [Elysia crispata]
MTWATASSAPNSVMTTETTVMTTETTALNGKIYTFSSILCTKMMVSRSKKELLIGDVIRGVCMISWFCQEE